MQILEGDGSRWAIWVCFRELKQLLGFADSSARKEEAVKRVAFVGLTYTMRDRGAGFGAAPAAGRYPGVMTRRPDLALAAALALAGCSRNTPAKTPMPPTEEAGPRKPAAGGKAFVPVKPVAAKARPSGGTLRIGAGQFFSYALPEGWRVGEDGQFALSLVAPDQKAFTVMVGNAGIPPGYDPGRFVYEKFMALRPAGLQRGPGRPARPVAGFAQAAEYDVAFIGANGRPHRGVAKCSVTGSYDTYVYAMTAAVSEADQWPGYARWLPAVADQISATNGAAFGVRGIMAQNLKNSVAFGEAARQYREWSQKTWQQVTDDRNTSVDRRNEGMRDVLGGTTPYANPFSEARTVELPQTHAHYWMDRQGNVVGTDDPSADPNVGSTGEWRRLERTR